MKNGVRYRIVDGSVMWMRDRNGNKVSFTYDSSTKRITKATDSLNRETTFEYSVNETPYGICDRITWPGVGGQSRIIRITRTYLINCLRSGSTMQLAQLFPGLSGDTIYNPNNLASTLWLPDGRSYQFRYNSYGELARVELPTGGAMEYDYGAGDVSLTTAGVYGPYSQTGPFYNPNIDPPRLGIFRRMSERRVYTDAANNTLQGKTVYDFPTIIGTIASGETSTAVIKNQDASSTTINAEKHYFYGSVLGSLKWDELVTARPRLETKECQTDALDPGLNALRTSINTWSEGLLPGGPQVTDTTLTLIETNQVSKKHFDYDIYGNVTLQEEYDFGVNAPGALVRRANTFYLGTNSINNAVYNNPYPVNTALPIIHIRNLPTKQQIFDSSGVLRSQTDYEYDNYNQTNPDAFHAALTPRPSISGLCDGSAQNCPNGPNFADATSGAFQKFPIGLNRQWASLVSPLEWFSQRLVEVFDKLENLPAQFFD